MSVINIIIITIKMRA